MPRVGSSSSVGDIDADIIKAADGLAAEGGIGARGAIIVPKLSTLLREPGATIKGNLDLQGESDTATLNTGSVSRAIWTAEENQRPDAECAGDSSDALPGAVNPLVLTGNNSAFNGSVLIDPNPTLEARAESLPPISCAGRSLLATQRAGLYGA